MDKIRAMSIKYAFIFVLLIPGTAHAAIGGPDSYGYSWIDSKSPSPSLPYNWIDISATGSDTGVYGDDVYQTVSVGFEFSFYGNKYTQVRVSSNGYLSFTDNASAYSNSNIPNSSSPNNLVSPFWDDLYVDGSGHVYYQTIGTAPNRIFIVQWSNVRFYSSGTLNTFQVQLYEGTNSIIFQYNSLGASTSGGSATVGIENSAGTIGLQYSLNSAVLTPGLAIEFMRQLEVASVFPANSAQDVSLSSNIRAVFNQSIDSSSITDSSIAVTGSVSGTIPGQINSLPFLNSLEFDPSTDFSPGETITVSLDPNLRSITGATIASTYTWTFTAGTTSDGRAPPPIAGLSAGDVPNDAGGKMQLSWSPSTAADIAYYKIYRETSPFTSVAGLTPALITNLTSFTDSTLDGVGYYYAVTAIDTSGND